MEAQKVLDLLPVRYQEERKNREMLGKLLDICEGNPEKLKNYIKRFFKSLFSEEAFDEIRTQYKKLYKDYKAVHPNAGEGQVFGNILQHLFQKATNKDPRRNRKVFRILMSLVSRSNYLEYQRHLTRVESHKEYQGKLVFPS
jgi:hypothetical protein